jgi:hypothetical protein
MRDSRPEQLFERIQRRRDARAPRQSTDTWRRETFRLPRDQARAEARRMFQEFPKAAYMTEIEYWRELANNEIEFVIRRLPSAE